MAVMPTDSQLIRREISSFIDNPGVNTLEVSFSLKDNENDRISLIVSDFVFYIDLETKFITEDEFLEPACQKANLASSSSLFEKLQIFTRKYEDLLELDDVLDIETPFELENDNHDMKFITRVRFTTDDFLDELFLSIFDYCSPHDLATISRVCKSWYKMVLYDGMWEKFCLKNKYEKEIGKTWRLSYFMHSDILDKLFILQGVDATPGYVALDRRFWDLVQKFAGFEINRAEFCCKTNGDRIRMRYVVLNIAHDILASGSDVGQQPEMIKAGLRMQKILLQYLYATIPIQDEQERYACPEWYEICEQLQDYGMMEQLDEWGKQLNDLDAIADTNDLLNLCFRDRQDY